MIEKIKNNTTTYGVVGQVQISAQGKDLSIPVSIKIDQIGNGTSLNDADELLINFMVDGFHVEKLTFYGNWDKFKEVLRDLFKKVNKMAVLDSAEINLFRPVLLKTVSDGSTTVVEHNANKELKGIIDSFIQKTEQMNDIHNYSTTSKLVVAVIASIMHVPGIGEDEQKDIKDMTDKEYEAYLTKSVSTFKNHLLV